jgi:hypothetical protein
MDSNHVKKINSLLCYRYTKEQFSEPRIRFERMTSKLQISCSTTELLAKKMEPEVGFEPTTDGLQNRCSTTELFRQKGLAGEGIEPS